MRKQALWKATARSADRRYCSLCERKCFLCRSCRCTVCLGSEAEDEVLRGFSHQSGCGVASESCPTSAPGDCDSNLQSRFREERVELADVRQTPLLAAQKHPANRKYCPATTCHSPRSPPIFMKARCTGRGEHGKGAHLPISSFENAALRLSSASASAISPLRTAIRGSPNTFTML